MILDIRSSNNTNLHSICSTPLPVLGKVKHQSYPSQEPLTFQSLKPKNQRQPTCLVTSSQPQARTKSLQLHLSTALHISSPQQLPAFTMSGTTFHVFSTLFFELQTQIWEHYIEADPWFGNINDPSNNIMSLGQTFRSPRT